jgi:predicted phosphate transport protein (TIGR00153 family)
MFSFLLPKELGFFDQFDKHAATCVEAATVLVDLCEHYGDMPAKVKRIKDAEHRADEITHATVAMLHMTFITPLDRDQIHHLITTLDDVIDLIQGAATRMELYEIKAPTDSLREMAKTLLNATLAVQTAVTGLRDMKNADVILKACIEINKYENDGDALRNAAVAKLFKEEKDAVTLFKWKEIYEDVETSLDKCEDVANIIEGLVLENA